MKSVDYCAFYCEENIWRLGRRFTSAGSVPEVVFISGERVDDANHVAMWSQRAGRPSDGLVLWDYHVVLRTEGGRTIWDLDCRDGFPLRTGDWLEACFPSGYRVPEVFQPRFRVMDYPDYVATFSSDRSHMLAESGYRSPPPAWRPITRAGVANNVLRFADMSDPFVGRIEDLAAFSAGLTRR